MVAMSNKNQYIAYYLQCAGVNPMQPSYDSFKKTYDEMVDLVVSVVEGAGSSGACTGPPAAFEAIVVALAELKVIIDEGGYLLSCDMVQPLVQNLAYDKFCDQMVDTIFLVWLVLAVGGFLTILALCLAPCITRALFPGEDDSEDPEKPGEGAAPEGDDLEGVVPEPEKEVSPHGVIDFAEL